MVRLSCWSPDNQINAQGSRFFWKKNSPTFSLSQTLTSPGLVKETWSSTEVELVAEPDLGIARVKHLLHTLSRFHVVGTSLRSTFSFRAWHTPEILSATNDYYWEKVILSCYGMLSCGRSDPARGNLCLSVILDKKKDFPCNGALLRFALFTNGYPLGILRKI